MFFTHNLYPLPVVRSNQRKLKGYVNVKLNLKKRYHYDILVFLCPWTCPTPSGTPWKMDRKKAHWIFALQTTPLKVQMNISSLLWDREMHLKCIQKEMLYSSNYHRMLVSKENKILLAPMLISSFCSYNEYMKRVVTNIFDWIIVI